MLLARGAGVAWRGRRWRKRRILPCCAPRPVLRRGRNATATGAEVSRRMDEPNAGQPGAAWGSRSEPAGQTEQAQGAGRTPAMPPTGSPADTGPDPENDGPSGWDADPQTPASAQVEPDGERGTVLVAENEENNRLLMEQILSMAGFRCVSAANGIEVLTALDRQRVDVVLLDLSMPVMDGYRTAQMIRQRADGAQLPVVAVTGYALEEDRVQALAVGCTDYLAKPFRPHELLAVVERMLRLRGENG